MDGSVSDAHAGDTTADALVVHDEVEAEVLDEESTIVGEGTTEEGVQHGVASTISHSAGSVSLF